MMKPHYAAQAKERMNQGRPKEGVEKIPQVMTAAQRAIIAREKHPQPTKSRDQAGKAAGVHCRRDADDLLVMIRLTVESEGRKKMSEAKQLGQKIVPVEQDRDTAKIKQIVSLQALFQKRAPPFFDTSVKVTWHCSPILSSNISAGTLAAIRCNLERSTGGWETVWPSNRRWPF